MKLRTKLLRLFGCFAPSDPSSAYIMLGAFFLALFVLCFCFPVLFPFVILFALYVLLAE